MCKRVFPLFAILLNLAALTSCSAPQEELSEDPILGLGHGAFFGPDGTTLIPDAEFIKSAQKYYILTLQKEPESSQAGAQVRKLIESLVDDEILANALFIDWLIETVEPDNLAHLTSVNNALRWYYVLNIQGDPVLPTGNEWSKGIKSEIAQQLEREGLTVFLKTNASGEKYVEECREAGVPVPQAMFSDEWAFQAIFDNEFISDTSQAELWLHTSESPPGVCLALPRYPGTGAGSSDEAGLLGIICLGTQSSKACFFDNPQGRAFRRNVEVPISEFVGGSDLVANGQGICTDCHRGENPYVVHPLKPAFAGLPSVLPLAWHDPLVVPSWPQNPGPINLLDVVASPGRCDDCHRVGDAGRFPEVATPLFQSYCQVVLATAVGPLPKRTMPAVGDISLFTAHIDALKAACQGQPSTGVDVDVDLPDDPGFVGSPLVIDPLYQCAVQVAVRGAILDAKLSLFINGSLLDSVTARNTRRVEFNVPALVTGDVVTAAQEFDGTMSAPSAPVTVRDHTVDFPSGLPAPAIDPALIYECAGIIAVRHVPGVKITVFTNGGDPRSRSTSTGWTAVVPGKIPFDIGDSFTAQASLCDDVSPVSAAESAVAAPLTLPAPTFNPPEIYGGQELVTVETLVNGSRTSLVEAGFGAIGNFTTPVSWFPDYDVATRMGRPLLVGDRLTAAQSLCDTSGPKTETPPAQGCKELPAPRIRHPLVGDNFVVVTESVPGARIRVYDDSNTELGDGSGTVIVLRRAITGADILTVVQQVGECTSATGYRVSVRNPDSG